MIFFTVFIRSPAQRSCTFTTYPEDMPRRAHDFRGLTQPRRLILLRAVQRVPGRRAGELASETGIPLNTVRDHLRVLEDEGLIRVDTVQVGTAGRPPVTYHPVRDAAAHPVAHARIEGAHERGRLLRAITPAEASPLDEPAQRQLDVLYEHLDDAGLEPHIDEASLTFELAPCRYHDMIDEDRALVCGVHARLVQDVLRQSEGPLALRKLQPFVTAHQCRVMLTRRADAAGTADTTRTADPSVTTATNTSGQRATPAHNAGH